MKDSSRKWYWIALNGPSCAISSLPWKEPATVPMAQQLIGFPTLAEARGAQQICLHKPMPEVERFFESLEPMLRAGHVRLIRPPDSQPYTKGTTYWMEAESPGSDEVREFLKTRLEGDEPAQ